MKTIGHPSRAQSDVKIVDRAFVEAALDNDLVQMWLSRHSEVSDEDLVCQRWLRQTPAKRAIWPFLYGDLFGEGPRLSIADVGGGLTALSAVLARRHAYALIDVLAHDDVRKAASMETRAGRQFIHAHDWIESQEGTFDVVIANDLFPNVDQRLELFLDAFLHRTRRMLLSLTFYENARWYATKRIDADETLYMLAWNGAQVKNVMEARADAIVDADFGIFDKLPQSIFANGRHVCLVELRGGLAGDARASR